MNRIIILITTTLLLSACLVDNSKNDKIENEQSLTDKVDSSINVESSSSEIQSEEKTNTSELTCDFNGAKYQVGDVIMDKYNCNSMTCSVTKFNPGSTYLFGTDLTCDYEVDKNLKCDYGGVEYSVGESFKDVDDCNTCSCSDSAYIVGKTSISCTMMACVKKEDVEHQINLK